VQSDLRSWDFFDLLREVLERRVTRCLAHAPARRPCLLQVRHADVDDDRPRGQTWAQLAQ